MTDILTEIDEALEHLNKVPQTARGAAWQAYLDAVLDQRPTKDGQQYVCNSETN